MKSAKAVDDKKTDQSHEKIKKGKKDKRARSGKTLKLKCPSRALRAFFLNKRKLS